MPPLAISTDIDFSSLLYGTINSEGKCDEVFPGALPPDNARSSGAGPEDSRPMNRLKAYDSGTGSGPSRSVTPLKKQSCQNRKQARVRQEEIIRNGYRAGSTSTQKYISKAVPIKTELNTATLPVARGAYTALNKSCLHNQNATVEELKAAGFQYIAIDPQNKKPMPIVDINHLIIGYVATPPDDKSYDEDIRDLFNIIIEESESDTFSHGELHHKRGEFPAVNFGWTLPNGFKYPINLDDSRHKDKISRITHSAGFKQISGVQNGTFAFWNPGVYNYQKTRVEKVLAEKSNSNRPKLKQNTPKTVFPTAACNFRNVCCLPHRDTQNCPFCWCAITALGKFDHTKGAHLILWELKLIIEFPHGYTILIPSATITHSNTPAADGDIRVSITQYCAGSVLRYADNLCHTNKDLRQVNRPLYEQNQADKDDRWRMALGLLSTLDDLKRGKHGHKVAQMFQ